MSINERINEFIRFKGMRVAEFERSCNLSKAYIRQVKDVMGSDKIELIHKKYPDLSLDWLILGEGEMVKPSQSIKDDSNVQVGGNASNVNINMGGSLDKALAEIAKVHDLLENMQRDSNERAAKAQEHIDRLITIIENMQKQ